MKYFKQLDLSTPNLNKELENLLDKKIINWHFNTPQICINGVKGHEDNIFYGVGSLDLDWINAYQELDEHGNSKVIVPKKENMLHEDDFRYLCTPFKNTLFEDMYNEIESKYTVGRIRLMKLAPHNSLSWHHDATDRLHYPIKTQDGCIMVIEDEVMHIPEQTWWATNTRYTHTAFNGSREDRIHLVVNVVEDYDHI